MDKHARKCPLSLMNNHWVFLSALWPSWPWGLLQKSSWRQLFKQGWQRRGVETWFMQYINRNSCWQWHLLVTASVIMFWSQWKIKCSCWICKIFSRWKGREHLCYAGFLFCFFDSTDPDSAHLNASCFHFHSTFTLQRGNNTRMTRQGKETADTQLVWTVLHCYQLRTCLTKRWLLGNRWTDIVI